MVKPKSLVLVLLMASVVFAAGCVQQAQTGEIDRMKNDSMMEKNDSMMEKGDTMMKNDTAMENASSAMAKYSGTVLAGTKAQVIDFNKADYDAALASDQVVLLYFYANWCPICVAEVPEMYKAFNELQTDKIVAFRVNFNDDQTDANEKSLAQQFQVPYQHTKIIIKNDGSFKKYPDTWNKDRYISEINAVLAA